MKKRLTGMILAACVLASMSTPYNIFAEELTEESSETAEELTEESQGTADELTAESQRIRKSPRSLPDISGTSQE